MKKTLSTLIGLLLAVSVFGGGSDSLSHLTISIATEGPDLYADSTPVLVGEKYLLVYVAQGQTFKGVLTDGSLVDPVNNAIAITGTAVEGSKCGYETLTYSASLYPAAGTFVIVLLDTRKADGSVGGLVAGHSAALSATSTKADGLNLSALNGGAGSGIGATVQPSVLDTVPTPVIASLAQGDGKVSLGIKDFAYGVNYEVQATTNLNTQAWSTAVSGGTASRLAASSANVESGVLKTPDIAVPAGDAVRFFRVIIPAVVVPTK